MYVPAENTQRAKLRVIWWDGRGRLISHKDSDRAAKGEWQYLSVKAAVPANAAYASLQLRGTDAYAAGDVFYFDAAQFDAGRFPTSYIPATDGAAARNAERLTYPTRGNLQTAQGGLSLWVKPAYGPSTAQTRTFFDARTLNGNGMRLYRNTTDRLVLEIGNGTNKKETRSPDILNWTENTWHHIVATWDRQDQKVFVDGALIASTATPVLPTQLNDDFTIGDSRDVNAPAAATFADVAIYNRVLSSTEISSLFNRTEPPHALASATFFADFDDQIDAYRREILSPEPTLTAGTEETTGTPWWFRAGSQYSFDTAGNLVKKLDADGNTIRYTYDTLDRLTRVQYPKGDDVAFTYDTLSRRTSMTDATGTTTYQYDNASQLTSVTYPGNKTVMYQYDMAGRQVQMTDPDGGITRYTYNVADELTGITDPQNLTTRYTYDAAGHLTQAVLGNGVKSLYTYDNVDELTKVENRRSDNTLINSFEYTLDAEGNRTRMTEADGDYTDYAYDNLYQLLSEVKKNSSDTELYKYAYTYDNVGDRLTMTLNGKTTNYTYDANNRLLTAGDVRFGYDARGNTLRKTDGSLTGSPVTQYQYDFESHLTKIIYDNGRKNYFAYDGDGIRQSKRDTTHAVRFIYDGINVLQEINQATQSTDAAYLQGIHGHAKQRRSNQDHWYLSDDLGSTQGLINASETVTDTTTYEAFGNIRSSTGTTTQPFKYIGSLGYYTDDEIRWAPTWALGKSGVATWGKFIARWVPWIAGPLTIYEVIKVVLCIDDCVKNMCKEEEDPVR